MRIYPALDLFEGKVVRLEKGDYLKRKIYSADPAQMARRWVDAGADWLHVVDLEGARGGEIRNGKVLEDIRASVPVSIQFGGGVRQKSDIECLLRKGISRIILGTKALDPAFLKEIAEQHPGRIAVSLDLRSEEVQVEGWLKGSGISIYDFFGTIQTFPLACLIVTDIDRDGTLDGMNHPKMKRLLERTPFPIILSGGVATLEDVRRLLSLQSPRLEGMIIGKALYEDRVDLKEAIALTKGG